MESPGADAVANAAKDSNEAWAARASGVAEALQQDTNAVPTRVAQCLASTGADVLYDFSQGFLVTQSWKRVLGSLSAAISQCIPGVEVKNIEESAIRFVRHGDPQLLVLPSSRGGYKKSVLIVPCIPDPLECWSHGRAPVSNTVASRRADHCNATNVPCGLALPQEFGGMALKGPAVISAEPCFPL